MTIRSIPTAVSFLVMPSVLFSPPLLVAVVALVAIVVALAVVVVVLMAGVVVAVVTASFLLVLNPLFLVGLSAVLHVGLEAIEVPGGVLAAVEAPQLPQILVVVPLPQILLIQILVVVQEHHHSAALLKVPLLPAPPALHSMVFALLIIRLAVLERRGLARCI